MGGGYLKGGWKRNKYVVAKANGEDLDPEAKYFVLRYDAPGGDPNARAAMRSYAINVRHENPKLADDILARIVRQEAKLVCRKCRGTGEADEGRYSKICRACGGSGRRRFKTVKKERR